MPVAFITGATGCLGQALAVELVREGWVIRSLSRSPIPPNVAVAQHYPVDLSRHTVPQGALDGVDAVFHCAALSSAWGARAAFHAANVGATERMLDAAKAARVPRFVHASTPSIYINGRSRLNVAEEAPLPPKFLTDYAGTKYIAEQLVRAANGPDFTTVTLRPRAIYGPHDRALLPRLLTAIGGAGEGRVLTLPGDGSALIDPTHASDAARAMRLAALADPRVAGGRAYNITSGQAVTVHELLDLLEPVIGRAIPRRHLPFGMAMAAAGMAERLQRLRNPAQEPRVTRHAVAALGLSLTLDISAARRDLGYQPQVTLAEGLAALDTPSIREARTHTHAWLPARPRERGVRLDLLQVGSCVAPGTTLRRDASPLPRSVPALVAILDHGAGQVSLFDTGYGRTWRQMTMRLPELAYQLALPARLPDSQQLDVALRRLGVPAPARVIFSHLHADHVAGLFDLAEIPPCLASRNALTELARLASTGDGFSPRMSAMFAALPVPLVQRLQALVDDGRLTEIEATPACGLPRAFAAFGSGHDLLGDGSVLSVPLPGHGSGQTGLWLPRSSRGPVLLAGDGVFSAAALRDGVMPPAAILARLGDPVAYARTFAALAQLSSEGVEVIASHDPDLLTV